MDLEFLDGTEPEAAEAPEPQGEEQKQDQPRDDAGRFAPKAEPEPVAEPAPEPAQEVKPEPGYVPLTAILDEREKRQQLEREVERLRQSQQAPEPVAIPDPIDDPEGFADYQQQQFSNMLYQQALDMSRRFAVQQHGDETVKAAMDWGIAKCNADPFFNAQVRNSGDPVGYAVQAYQREQIATEVTPDALAEFKAWKAAQAAAQAGTPQQQAAPASPTIAPPRSIASAPSAGGGGAAAIPTGPGQAFDSFVR